MVEAKINNTIDATFRVNLLLVDTRASLGDDGQQRQNISSRTFPPSFFPNTPYILLSYVEVQHRCCAVAYAV